MVSNAVVFMLAGYETTSTALSYAAHELASNPDVQTRLQEELDNELSGVGKKVFSLLEFSYFLLEPVSCTITPKICLIRKFSKWLSFFKELPDYQSLSQLQYLDMVFNEVLRKHPIAPS